MSADRLVPLTNDAWGFDSCCFVCEPRNTTGLGIPFHHDVAAARVVAEFTLDERFSGAPRHVHGGVLLAILDEAMAWSTIAIAGTFAVTRETTSRFDRPVEIGVPHSVVAEIADVDDRAIGTRAWIEGPRAVRCVEASATFVALDLERANAAVGATITGDATSYLRDDSAR